MSYKPDPVSAWFATAMDRTPMRQDQFNPTPEEKLAMKIEKAQSPQDWYGLVRHDQTVQTFIKRLDSTGTAPPDIVRDVYELLGGKSFADDAANAAAVSHAVGDVLAAS